MLGRQIGFSAFAFVLTFAINLFKIKYLATALTPEEYGLYSLFFNTVSFGSLVLLLGFDRYIATYAALESKADALRLTWSCATFYCLLTLAVAPFVSVLPGEMSIKLHVLVGMFLIGISHLLRFYLLASQKVTTYNVLNLIMLHLWVPLAVMCGWVMRLNLELIFFLMNLGFAASAGCAAWAIWKDRGQGRFFYKPQLKDIITGLTFSLPLLPVALASKFLQVGDRFFLLTYEGARGVALYSMAIALVNIIISLLTVLSDTIRPYILREGITVQGKALICNAIAVMLIVICSASAGCILFGEAAIKLIATPVYVEAAKLFTWLVPVLLAQAFIPIATFLLERQKASKIVGGIYLLSAGTYVGLNIVLGPEFGMIGCAISYSISMTLLAVILGWRSGLFAQLSTIDWHRLCLALTLTFATALAMSQTPLDPLISCTIFAIGCLIILLAIGRPFVAGLSGKAPGMFGAS